MSNYKVLAKRERIETNKITGEVRKFVETDIEEQSPPCKECKKEPRKHGSSRCQKCSDSKKIQTSNKSRLERRIEEAKLKTKQ